MATVFDTLTEGGSTFDPSTLDSASLGLGDGVDLSTFGNFATTDATGGDLAPLNWNFADNLMPDFSPYAPLGGWADIFAPILPPVLNLPQPQQAGFTGFFHDVSNVVDKVYAGMSHLSAVQSGFDLQKARESNALQTVQTKPNVWLVAGLVGAGFFALKVMEGGKAK